MTIAKQILSYLGGNKFVACTGCKDFMTNAEQDSLTMTIPRNGSKANRLEVKYDWGTDTFTMRFYRHSNGRFSQKKWLEGKEAWTPPKDTELKTYDGVYCDMLRRIFENYTGMVVPMSITINGHKFC